MFTAGVPDKQRAVVSFVATYLKPEMLHVHRQTTSLQRYENWVVTRRRECERLFPARNVVILRRHPLRWFYRLWHRTCGRRIPLDPHERRQLHDVCGAKEAALIHIYFGTEAARCIPFLKQAKLPKVVSFHGADLSEKLSQNELESIMEHTDIFLCRSKALAEDLASRGADGSRIRLNYTGVPVTDATTQSRPSRTLRLLQACRFLTKKGLDTTIRAVAQLRASGHDVTLTLAGDGVEKDPLRKLVADLGLSDITGFAGFVNEMELRQVYLEHDIFVHPSRTTETGDREGIPNSLLEAMACGLPVVATRHGGIPEAITHGETGWLIERSDPEELAAAIGTLADSPDLRARLGSSARREIIDRFSIEACIRALEEAYDEAAGRRA